MNKSCTIEYENTYLMKFVPKDLILAEYIEIIDIYIPRKTTHPRLRIRKRENRYEICKKFPVKPGDGSEQHEFTIPLDGNEFDELNTNLKGKRARKYRYLYKHENRIAEIDVFQDDLNGLISVDFEFDNENDKNQFIMPNFCLVDVTQETAIAGGMLVGKSYSDIAPILDKYNYKPLFIK
ncbi:hypothetical protein ACFL2U_01130 [Patescibacteria group bacterium]